VSSLVLLQGPPDSLTWLTSLTDSLIRTFLIQISESTSVSVVRMALSTLVTLLWPLFQWKISAPGTTQNHWVPSNLCCFKDSCVFILDCLFKIWKSGTQFYRIIPAKLSVLCPLYALARVYTLQQFAKWRCSAHLKLLQLIWQQKSVLSKQMR